MFQRATSRQLLSGLLAVAACLACAPASAAPVRIDFSGRVAVIDVNFGSTSLSGTEIGDPFSFSVIYDDEPGEFSFCDDVNSCSYVFFGDQYGGSFNGGVPFSGQSVLIIQDDYSFSQSETPVDDLAIANALLDPDITLDTPFDFWQVGTGTPDESVFFSFGVLTLDTSLRTSPDFDPQVPAAGADAIVFILEEETFTGEFSAVGIVDSFETTVVPLPAAGWLLFGALGALAGFARRRAVSAND